MVALKDLIKINDFEWEIPTSFDPDMKVPVRIFAKKELIETVLDDGSLQQAVNSASLPGLVGKVFVMPDIHQGYGFPIGGVAATRYPEGVISPGGIGYDINCGVRLLVSKIDANQAEPSLDSLASLLNDNCPSGVGKKGKLKLSEQELESVCRNGSLWALKKGFATKMDLQRTEEQGRLEGADPVHISKRARERGREQLGTLGAGNHFIEVDVVDQIFDTRAAQAMNIRENCLVIQIHCGSRGLGHQVCSDYVDEFQNSVKKFGIKLRDRELVCAPMTSQEGQAYLSAMRCAANYAFANRQVLAHYCRQVFDTIFGGMAGYSSLSQVYDIAHNIGKIETHFIDDEWLRVCVHRKGATRAFGPNHADLPPEYQSIGQPVLVPGSMGTSSWVLVGTEQGMTRTFGSSCHGAGRTMSRSQAKKRIRGENLQKQLNQLGIRIRSGSMMGLAEEAPQAYKDVDAVVETVTGAGIAKKVARLLPLAVIKG